MNYKDSEKAEGAAEGPSDNRLHFPWPCPEQSPRSRLRSRGRGMATLVCRGESVVLSWLQSAESASLARSALRKRLLRPVVTGGTRHRPQ